MKTRNIAITVLSGLALAACGPSAVEKVQQTVVEATYGKTATIRTVLEHWEYCRDGKWTSFSVEGSEFVNYECSYAQDNVSTFTEMLRKSTSKNPNLIKTPESVTSTFQWMIGKDGSTELVGSVFTWTFGGRKAEEVNEDGSAVARGNEEKFDISFFGDDHRNKMVSEMFAPKFMEMELRSHMPSFKSRLKTPAN